MTNEQQAAQEQWRVKVGTSRLEGPNGMSVTLRVFTEEEAAFLAYMNQQSAALAIAEKALEAAVEKFERIQNIALPSTMIMARAVDGEDEARDALTAIKTQA